MDGQISKYDKHEEFVKYIAPLVAKIDTLCGIYQIPYFFTAATQNDADGTKYENRARTAYPMSIELKNDQLINHVKVAAGFDTVICDKIPDIEL